MACRGVFFALNSAQNAQLLGLSTGADRLKYIQEDIESAWDQAHILETDKAWDAIHRCLTDGTPSVTPSADPLSKLVLGGKQLYTDTQSYIINFIEHSELGDISAALKKVTKEWMKKRYDQLKNSDYPQEFISEQDWVYTWDWFSGIPEFIARADREGRSVIFTVDQ